MILFWSVKKWDIFKMQPYSVPCEDDVCPIRRSHTLWEFTQPPLWAGMLPTSSWMGMRDELPAPPHSPGVEVVSMRRIPSK